MKLTQISIFLENKKGRLYEVCSLLGKHKINMRALNIAESEGFGILRIVVDRPQQAVRVLKENNFVANLTEIVAVEVEDKPGGLARILKIIADNQINVEYMYGFLEKYSDNALLVFRFENPDKAIQVLKKNKINAIGKNELKGL
jgi:hypothetical protein